MRTFRVEELADIRTAARAIGADAHHLVSVVYMDRYIRIADSIREMVGAGQVLDWGCGYGQMTYLLRKRGLTVASYEIEDRPGRRCLPNLSDVPITLGSEGMKLPFPDSAFDAVLSCGVLEHVRDFDLFLEEIRRVLKKGGLFFIFFLPTPYALTGWFRRWMGRWSHLVFFTGPDVRRLLRRHGMCVLNLRRRHLLPRLNGFPAGILRADERSTRKGLAYHALRRFVALKAVLEQ